MKTIFLKLALLAIMVGSSLFTLFLLPLSYDESLSLIINKISILDQSSSPRVIVVGGSGCYSGFESPLVHQEMGFNVVNLGLYAGFGVLPLLDIISPRMRPQDIVLIIPEYGIIESGFINDEKTRKWLLAVDPAGKLKSYFQSRKEFINLFRDLSELIQSKLSVLPKSLLGGTPPGFVRARKVINQYGDLTDSGAFHRVSIGSLEGKGHLMSFRFSDDPLEKMNAFSRLVGRRGGKIFFIFPAFPLEEYKLNEGEIVSVFHRIQNNLQFPILGEPTDFLYHNLNFLDTTNHLDAEGKRRRTQRVIELLKTALNN